MARRLQQTMADFVVIAISPALIMTLVGSLVFFLLEVLYQGQFEARLHWILACFVFGAVLIGRISIEEGFERAAPFGLALATVVGLAAMRFVEIRGTWIDQFGFLINWALIALIWWCAHRLTWDCTVIDDAQDASGQGLLETAGLERPAGDERTDAASQEQPTATELPIEGTTWRQHQRASLWQRYVERQRKPHAPGVWVVYFSLAALPIFGIGQWFIPDSDVAGRRHAFGLLCVYVASGLGLLLTTSFLGLRRYLRQRRVEMPTTMANTWLGVGAAIIGLLLIFAAILPRPSAEYSISELPFSVGSPELGASRFAPVPREGTKDEQPGSAPDNPSKSDTPESDQTTQQPRAGDQAGGSQGKSSPDSSSAGQQSSPNQKEPSDAQSGQSTGKQDASSKSGAGQSGGQSSGQSKAAGGKANGSSSSKSSGQQSSESKGQGAVSKDRGQDRQSAQSDKNQASGNSKSASKTDQTPAKDLDQRKSQPQNQSSPNASQGQSPPNAATPPQTPDLVPTAALAWLADLLKWIVYALVVLATFYAVWHWWADILAAIRDFLAGIWPRKSAASIAASKGAEPEFPPPAFATFADPFVTGFASRYSVVELVRYSFEAFEAWSREHGCPRKADQTPHELVRDVTRRNAEMGPDARNLAELYASAAYARGELPAAASDQLRHLWQQMRATAAHPF